ncbi:MAG: GGDEF domain-containing protein [Paenisporosarcina sp.]
MDWYNEYVTDLFLYNSVCIGLATFSAFLTKRYGVFSGRTIFSLIALYTGLLLFMLLNPYYEIEFFNSLFMIAPVIMVRVYYDIRLTYVFMLFIIFASQLKYFLHSTNTVDLSLGLLYLFLSAIIILIPTLKNKTLHTFILFSASYAATILSLFIWPTIAIENIGLEILLWGLNIFTLTFIASKIVPDLMEFVEMTYTKRDLEIDALTGVYNRLSFNQHMDMLFLKERNKNLSTFSILFFDINKFKYINDTYGHLVGDYVLMAFAKKLEQELQADEKVFRYGGDEFVVYTPKTGESLQKFIDHLDRNVQDLPQSIEGHFIIVNYSIGVAEYKKDTRSVPEMVKIADEKMFINKHSASSIV